jgi:hypothetical protein
MKWASSTEASPSFWFRCNGSLSLGNFIRVVFMAWLPVHKHDLRVAHSVEYLPSQRHAHRLYYCVTFNPEACSQSCIYGAAFGPEKRFKSFNMECFSPQRHALNIFMKRLPAILFTEWLSAQRQALLIRIHAVAPND